MALAELVIVVLVLILFVRLDVAYVLFFVFLHLVFDHKRLLGVILGELSDLGQD